MKTTYVNYLPVHPGHAKRSGSAGTAVAGAGLLALVLVVLGLSACQSLTGSEPEDPQGVLVTGQVVLSARRVAGDSGRRLEGTRRNHISLWFSGPNGDVEVRSRENGLFYTTALQADTSYRLYKFTFEEKTEGGSASAWVVLDQAFSFSFSPGAFHNVGTFLWTYRGNTKEAQVRRTGNHGEVMLNFRKRYPESAWLGYPVVVD